jgi:hypothetical protein
VNTHTLIIAGSILAGLTLVTVACPPLRRVAGALTRFAMAHLPKWLAFILAPVLFVCAFIPGPVDELAVLAIALGPVLKSAAHRAELAVSVRQAWKG